MRLSDYFLRLWNVPEGLYSCLSGRTRTHSLPAFHSIVFLYSDILPNASGIPLKPYCASVWYNELIVFYTMQCIVLLHLDERLFNFQPIVLVSQDGRSTLDICRQEKNLNQNGQGQLRARIPPDPRIWSGPYQASQHLVTHMCLTRGLCWSSPVPHLSVRLATCSPRVVIVWDMKIHEIQCCTHIRSFFKNIKSQQGIIYHKSYLNKHPVLVAWFRVFPPCRVSILRD